MTAALKELFDYGASRHYNSIARATEPLGRLLNISYFAYQKVDAAGGYSVACNNPDFADFYLENQFYLHDPYLVEPSRYSEGKHFHFLSSKLPDLDEGLAKIFQGSSSRFHFGESVLIINKSYDYYEIYVFAIQANEKVIPPFYANQVDLLERFITNFKKYNRKLIEDVDQAKVNIAQIRGEDFNLLRPNYHVIDQDVRNNFLELCSPEEHMLRMRLKELTARERECLYWMIEGKTAGETGEILGISGRTVEVYRGKCRDKLGSHYTFTNLCYLLGKFGLL